MKSGQPPSDPVHSEDLCGNTDPALLHRLQLELRQCRNELDGKNSALEHARADLAQARQYYRRLYDLAPAGYISLEPDGGITDCNLTASEMLGASTEKLRGKKLADFVLGLHRATFMRCFREAARGSQRQICEVKLRRNNYQCFYTRIKVTAQHNEEGRLYSLGAVMEDINEEHRLREELTHVRQSLQQERQLFSSGPVTVFKWLPQPGWPVEYASSNVQTLTGYPAQDFMSGHLPYAALVHTEDFSRMEQAVDHACVSGQEWVCHEPCRLLHQNGNPVWVLTFTVIFRDASHQPLYYLGYAVEINAYKSMEEELRQAKQQAERISQTKSEFIASMSHELRTPLNGILGFAQILAGDSGLDSRQQDSVRTIQRSGEHLLDLINDILDLSKIEAGKMELHPVEFHFSDFLHGIVDIMQVRTHPKDIAFIYEFDPELPGVVCTDATRLRQTLINLLGNAIKFTDYGKVEFKVWRTETKIHFEISDTGEGIAPDQMEKIFEPFHQISSFKHQGTGLGLTISRYFIEMLGGVLKVSSHPGQGSAFSFSLLLPEVHDWQAPDTANRKLPCGYKGPRRSILIVDDERINRAILMNVLGGQGFDVYEMDSGMACLDKVTQMLPDAILMDLVMPDMDGLETVRNLRRLPQCAGIPVLAISANVFEQHKKDSLLAGCDDFLSKPVDLRQLLEKLGHWLMLEWQYPQETATMGSEPMLPPPPEQVDALHKLILRGDVRGVMDEALRLQKIHPEYTAFTEKIYTMAESFQLRQMEHFIQNCLHNPE